MVVGDLQAGAPTFNFPPLPCRDRAYDGPHPSSHLHIVVRASFVPLLCPSTRQLTASRGLTRPPRLARSPGLPRGIRHIKLVPKLTVRVRFPSPAPCSNTVAAEPYSRIPVLCRTRVSVLARATLGHTYPHLGTRPSASEDAQLVPLCDPVLRFFQRRQGESPRIRGRVNGLNYRSHARAGARDTQVPVRLTIRLRHICPSEGSRSGPRASRLSS